LHNEELHNLYFLLKLLGSDQEEIVRICSTYGEMRNAHKNSVGELVGYIPLLDT